MFSSTPGCSADQQARLVATLWSAAGLVGVSLVAAAFWTLVAAVVTPWSAGTLATLATTITAFLMLACSPLMLAGARADRVAVTCCAPPRQLA
ncbi:MAG: hypothetical protein ACOYLQ_04845 [Hyphomicrobiaceae bacterium]|jgi:uncharacterized membrane protein